MITSENDKATVHSSPNKLSVVFDFALLQQYQAALRPVCYEIGEDTDDIADYCYETNMQTILWKSRFQPHHEHDKLRVEA